MDGVLVVGVVLEKELVVGEIILSFLWLEDVEGVVCGVVLV